MRQRVIIAMALALNPELVIMDEPTTALDVVVQREILQQIKDLQERARVRGPLHHARPLAALRGRAPDRDHVRGRGRRGRRRQRSCATPRAHPYTLGLIESFPPLTGPIERMTGIPGSPPDLASPPPGCRFHPRCPHCRPEQGGLYELQTTVRPILHDVGPGTRWRAISWSSRDDRLDLRADRGPRTDEALRGGQRPGRRRGRLHAVDDVTFTLRPGTVTALVGESGSGKSTVARMLARLYEPTSGSVFFEGKDVTNVSRRRDVLHYRSQVQMIFQDPFGSLNPVKTIHHHLARPLKIHGIAKRADIDRHIEELLTTVGLVPPERYVDKYPYELSGGQRQRVAIARALAVEPTVLVADEPTSMLDVSIRVGILNLIVDLKERKRPCVPLRHPRSRQRALRGRLHARHVRGPDRRARPRRERAPERPASVHAPAARVGSRPGRRQDASGSRCARVVASAAIDPAAGCRFADRCPLRIGICTEITPQLVLTAGRAQRPLPRHRTLPCQSRGSPCPVNSLSCSQPTSCGAPQPPRTRSKERRTRTAAAKACGTGSAPRPGRSGTATAARSPATSTTATATTSH